MISLGVIGEKITHSFSPAIFKIIARELELKLSYKIYDIKDIHELQQIVIQEKLIGFNVTIPYKENILPLCSDQTYEVKSIGAANTIKIENNKWYAHNTDTVGIENTFREHHIKILNNNILLMGAGGAAKACLNVIGDLKASNVYIMNRTKERAKNLIERLEPQFPRTKFHLVEDKPINHNEISLYINATSIGMKGRDQLSPLSPTNPKAKAFDLVYTPIMTPFLNEAYFNGISTINGLNMLIWQALSSFEIWVEEIYNKIALKETIKKELMIKISEGTLS